VLPISVRWIAASELRAEDVEACADVLDASERARARGFAFALERNAYAAAHVLKRRVLANILHADASALRFRTSASGKPHLAGPCEVPFSLTHTRSLVACAAGGPMVLGIDAEDVRPDPPLDNLLLEQTCSPAERALLAAMKPGDVPAAFTRLWTMKEAVLKACGEGIVRSPSEIECALAPPRLVRAPHTPAGGMWQLFSWRPLPEVWLTLAVCSNDAVCLDARAVLPAELFDPARDECAPQRSSGA
jgi:4'-phosphopantetheinyl transferase